MEQNEFNKLMAEMEKFFASMPPCDYYKNLNILMPLAWKHEIELEKMTPETWCATKYIWDGQGFTHSMHQNKDPIEAIRQCLIEIARGEG